MATRQTQTGFLLLISLVLMSIILVAALVISTIVIRDLQLTSVVDDGQVAFSIAEEIAENTLYQILVTSSEDIIVGQGEVSAALRGGSYSRIALNESSSFIYDFLDKNKTIYLDLYNSLNTNDAAEIIDTIVTWKGGGTIEIGFRQWDGAILGPEVVKTCPSACPPGLLPNPGPAYSMRVAPLTGAITDLRVTTFDGGGKKDVEIPVTVRVTGFYNRAEQAVEISLPKSPPWGP